MMNGKHNEKMHLSSSQLLDESIGVVGASCLNTMNSNQGAAVREQLNAPGGANYNNTKAKNKLVSPNVVRKGPPPKQPNY